MPEMVLDELKAHSGVQQVRGNRVPERVGGAVTRKARGVPVANEPALDLSPLKRSVASLEERAIRIGGKLHEVFA